MTRDDLTALDSAVFVAVVDEHIRSFCLIVRRVGRAYLLDNGWDERAVDRSLQRLKRQRRLRYSRARGWEQATVFRKTPSRRFPKSETEFARRRPKP